jgi:hypothetical protein
MQPSTNTNGLTVRLRAAQKTSKEHARRRPNIASKRCPMAGSIALLDRENMTFARTTTTKTGRVGFMAITRSMIEAAPIVRAVRPRTAFARLRSDCIPMRRAQMS